MNIRRSVVAALLLTMSTTLVATDISEQLFTDQQAARILDDLSEKGIQRLLTWRQRFHAHMAIINAKLDNVDNLLETEFSVTPNFTATVADQMSIIDSRLDTAQGKIDALNLSSSADDGLKAFMRTPTSTVNLNGDFDATNRDGGTYTVPQHGLYKVYVRSVPGPGVAINVMRNGNETLSSFESNGYYDIRTRIKLVWLNPGDEIFTTGSEATYFGVTLLRVQTLMPDYLN